MPGSKPGWCGDVGGTPYGPVEEDFDEEDDGYCQCGAYHYQDEVDGVCKCCGLEVDPMNENEKGTALAPIPMLLWCPECGERHIDVDDFATRPHHTHACQSCGMVWRPAVIHTVGVQWLPGFKNTSQGQS